MENKNLDDIYYKLDEISTTLKQLTEVLAVDKMLGKIDEDDIEWANEIIELRENQQR